MQSCHLGLPSNHRTLQSTQPHFPVHNEAMSTCLIYILFSVSICDSSEEQPPMEELDDGEGLLGGWGAEGDTVQGEVIDPPGETTHTRLLSRLRTPTTTT